MQKKGRKYHKKEIHAKPQGRQGKNHKWFFHLSVLFKFNYINTTHKSTKIRILC